MSDQPDEKRERFTLKQKRGWFVIERLIFDPDMEFFIKVGEVARFETREDARLFMVARSEATA